ncbi:MAG: peptidylprolyl isomerase [Candidatus Micrarchaeota archaeon]
MRAQHILVSTSKEADRIMNELNSETLSFSEAARSFSTCPSKRNNGDLGNFEKGQMVKEFEQACLKAKVGKLIGPVKTSFGYHIIRVLLKNDVVVSKRHPPPNFMLNSIC